MLIARCTARASLNTAVNFRDTSEAVTQACAPRPHRAEAAHPARSPSQGEMGLGGLMKKVAGKSWLWCYVCLTCRLTWGRSQLWASCSVREALQVCFKCACLGSSSVIASAVIAIWSKRADETHLLWPYQMVWRETCPLLQTLLPSMYLYKPLLSYL